ncbi:MAG: hypothetical protein JWO37_3710 [Acidimicrobiales bacterium]|jgi:taurine dioxygenase|nr:hypothetical protein [Acidimicrobiales bacterium]
MTLDLVPVTATFGVEVSGLDLRSANAADFEALRDALLQHRLLLFRSPSLDSEEQVRVMESLRVGEPLHETAQAPAWGWVTNTGELPDDGGIVDASPTELLWHADYEFTEFGPIQAISLYGHEVPEASYPTMLSNNVEAVKRLPADLREKVRTLKVLKAKEHTGPGEGYDDFANHRNRVSAPAQEGNLFHGSEHDIIETHPITGEPWLTVSQMMTSHVVGWTDEESDVLFAELDEIAYDPSNVYEHDWRVGDLIVWDNIALRHRRGTTPKGSTPGGRRVLRRVAVDSIDMLTRFPVARPAESLQVVDR